MGSGGADVPRWRALVAALVAVALCGCAGSGSGGGSTGATDGGRLALAAAETSGGEAASTISAADAPTDEAATANAHEDPTDLPPFAEVERSSSAETARSVLLTDVRTGRHDGFERIVFEFAGPERPGYRVQWVQGPVLADGSGNTVDIEGAGHLQIVMDPASGVDLATGTTTYAGPDRIEADPGVESIRELVRTGDFEGMLTWVVGVDAEAPFRVVTLRSPTRLVVDVQVAATEGADPPA